jgi:hypothetical protein
MRVAKWFWMGCLAALAMSGGQASAEYYGYGGEQASGQAPAPSGQANYTCQPSSCYVEKHGCWVYPCPCPCNPAKTCYEINEHLPPIKPPPTCQEVPYCEVKSELPAHERPVCVEIWRNCYVPIRVKKVEVPGPPILTATFQVKWREYHVLCKEDGTPLSSEQSAAVLKELGAQFADAAAPAPASAAAPAPAPAPAAAPGAVPAPPFAPPVAQAEAPVKRWVWLEKQGLYGFGYQRPDGLWVIDPGSKRPTLPTNNANAPAQPTALAPTITASTGS